MTNTLIPPPAHLRNPHGRRHRPGRQSRPIREARATIAVMCPLTPPEMKAVLHAFDPARRIVEGRGAVNADVVIVRPCSPQTLSGLRRRFPATRILACETDAEGRITIGPVHRTEETTAPVR